MPNTHQVKQQNSDLNQAFNYLYETTGSAVEYFSNSVVNTLDSVVKTSGGALGFSEEAIESFESASYQAASYVYSVGEYAVGTTIRTFPNFEEMYVNALPTVAVEMVAETWVNFGSDLVAKEIFRDVAKLAGIGYAYYEGTEYGSTGFKYDAANVWGQAFKVVCKSAALGGAYAYGGFAFAKMIAPVSNMGCEMPTRAMIIIGRQMQEKGVSEEDVLGYFADNIDSEIIASAVTSTFGKKLGATIMGKLVGNLGLYELSKQASASISETIYKNIFGGELNLSPISISESGSKIVDSAYQTLEKAAKESPLFVPVVLAVEYAIRNLGSLVNSYILIPLARLFQEAASELTKFEYISFGLEEAEHQHHLIHRIFEMFGLTSENKSSDEISKTESVQNSLESEDNQDAIFTGVVDADGNVEVIGA